MRRISTRTGMTLVELLVVVTIMVILIATALPLIKADLEGRRVREASRMVNTYLTVAQGRAVETNRPVGVAIEEQKLTIVETPPPYAGDIVGAEATIGAAGNTATIQGTVGSALITLYNIPINMPPPLQYVVSSVDLDDYIRFNYRGPVYRISQITRNTSPTTFVIEFTGDPLPPAGAQLPFQIYRKPVESSIAPLELPTGVIVDLANCGFGFDGHVALDATADWSTGRTIMFGPDGSVVRVAGGSTATIPVETIHLLVGDIGKAAEIEGPMNASASDTTPVTYNSNLTDNVNFWVSVGSRSGRITTAENGWADLGNFTDSLAAAREFAQSAQSMGGR